MARPVRGKPQRDMSRLRRHAMNTLGVLYQGQSKLSPIYRSEQLDILDQYYEGCQYDDLIPWEDAKESENFVPVRKRKPRIVYALPKLIVDKVAAKLIGSSVFPQFLVEDEEDDTAFLRVVQKAAQFRRSLIEPMRQLLKSGSVFVRYSILNGKVKVEAFNSKYCYPTFDPDGTLTAIEIKYVFSDWQDLDEKSEPRRKWYRMILTEQDDIMYDNPPYRPESKPEFEEVSRVTHGLGWVQGTWMVTHENKFSPDGYSIFGDLLDFCDELNYNLSQGSQAASYNQEPQMAINGMDEDEIDSLIRSSERAWNLGREGEGKFIESTLAGMEQASNLRSEVKQCALDIARVVINDPDKMKGAQPQSGEALKQLYAPLIELVDEIRQIIEPRLIELLVKIGLTLLHYNALGEDTAVETPKGYVPQSLDITVQWPPIFPPTIQDIHIASQAANQLSMSQIISRESLTRWIGQMIPSVDNIEEELEKIESQEPLPSPFGTEFGGSGGQE